MPRTVITQAKMMENQIKLPVDTALSESQRHSPKEFLDEGSIGYRQLSDRQTLLKMQLHELMSAEYFPEEDADDDLHELMPTEDVSDDFSEDYADADELHDLMLTEDFSEDDADADELHDLMFN
jgi:hypothetical protein